jgi:hypothetical protein
MLDPHPLSFLLHSRRPSAHAHAHPHHPARGRRIPPRVLRDALERDVRVQPVPHRERVEVPLQLVAGGPELGPVRRKEGEGVEVRWDVAGYTCRRGNGSDKITYCLQDGCLGVRRTGILLHGPNPTGRGVAVVDVEIMAPELCLELHRCAQSSDASTDDKYSGLAP